MHGQPKKLAAVSVQTRGDLVVATVERNAIGIITVTTPYKKERGSLDQLRAYFDFSDNLNLKLLREIDGEIAVARITSRRLADLTVHECWQGPCTVELRANAQAPVWQLPVREPLVALQWSADFTLVPGRVLWDHRRRHPCSR